MKLNKLVAFTAVAVVSSIGIPILPLVGAAADFNAFAYSMFQQPTAICLYL